MTSAGQKDHRRYAERVAFERITTDSEVMGGLPCIRGMRMPVATIVGLVANGQSTQRSSMTSRTSKLKTSPRHDDTPLTTGRRSRRGSSWTTFRLLPMTSTPGLSSSLVTGRCESVTFRSADSPCRRPSPIGPGRPSH